MDIDDTACQPTVSDPDEATLPDGPTIPEAPEAPDEPDELTLARDLVLRAHPDVVHELVTGSSLADLLASIPAAEAAFARVVATTREAATREALTAPVPGGGGVRSANINLEGLGPLAKIRAGLGQT